MEMSATLLCLFCSYLFLLVIFFIMFFQVGRDIKLVIIKRKCCPCLANHSLIYAHREVYSQHFVLTKFYELSPILICLYWICSSVLCVWWPMMVTFIATINFLYDLWIRLLLDLQSRPEGSYKMGSVRPSVSFLRIG